MPLQDDDSALGSSMTRASRARRDFEVAFICALPLEAACIENIFDTFSEDEGKEYGKAPGDPNSYTTGVCAGHNVVLVHLPGMGKVNAARAAASLSISFPQIKLAIVVGICGGMPQNTNREEVILGDVVISQKLIQYDFGRQYPNSFARKTGAGEDLGQTPLELRSVLAKLQTLRSRQKLQAKIEAHLSVLQMKMPGSRYPGVELDHLYASSYLHRHQNSSQHTCSECANDQVCLVSRTLSCDQLGCDSAQLKVRQRLATEAGRTSLPTPAVHFGNIGSGDSVIKSGQLRDKMAKDEGIIAFEMEGAGVWESFPSIIIKGVCDYADCHKNKHWQQYAAATAACCAKAILARWAPQATAAAEVSTVRRAYHLDVSMQDPLNSSLPGPVWCVPFDNMPNFVGREAEVLSLKEKLFSNTKVSKVAICGLGGMGKSRLAWEMADFARKSGNCAVFWVQATSASTLEQDYRRIGEALSVPGLSDQNSDVKEIIKQQLSDVSIGRWLMILDNADDEAIWDGRPRSISNSDHLVNYVPFSSSGSVLITTRSRRVAMQLAGREIITLQHMSSDEAGEMLDTLTIDSDNLTNPAMSLKLVEQLALLPLAIVQAAAYINVNSLSHSEYLELLHEAKEEDIIDLLSEEFEDETRYKQNQNSVASTWLISFRQIQRNNSRAIDFLCYMSQLSEKGIPQSLLPETKSKKELVDIIGVLIGYCFITKHAQYSTDQPLYDMHRLVRLAIRNWIRSQDTVQYWAAESMQRVSDVFSSPSFENRNSWRLFVPHAQVLCAANDGSTQGSYCKLLLSLGDCSIYERTYQQTIAYRSLVVDFYQKQDGDLDEKLFHAYYGLGEALLNGKDYRRSVKYLQLAYDGYTRLYGPKHRKTIEVMGNVTSSYRKLGRLAEAEDVCQQAMKLCDENLPPDDHVALFIAQRLASVYHTRGKLSQAEHILDRVVDVYMKLYGPKDQRTLSQLIDLGELYRVQERYADAERVVSKCIETYREICGPDHYDTIKNTGRLAVIYRKLGRWDDAEELEKSVLESTTKLHGADHPDSLASMESLSLTYRWQSRYEEAEVLQLRVLDLSKNVYDLDHPKRLIGRFNLAVIYELQNRVEEAEQLVFGVVEASQRVLGPDHKHTKIYVSAYNRLREEVARCQSSEDS